MTVGDMAAATTADNDFESASQVTSQNNLSSWDASTTGQSTAGGEQPRFVLNEMQLF